MPGIKDIFNEQATFKLNTSMETAKNQVQEAMATNFKQYELYASLQNGNSEHILNYVWIAWGRATAMIQSNVNIIISNSSEGLYIHIAQVGRNQRAAFSTDDNPKYNTISFLANLLNDVIVEKIDGPKYKKS